MKRRGRKTALDAALQKRLCALLAKGNSIQSACALSGIGERTYHDWNTRGKAGEQRFAAFFSAATRAREQHKARLIAVVMEAARQDARHAEWLLERMWPNEFGRVAERPLQQPLLTQAPTQVTVNVRRSTESDAAVKLFGKRASGPAGRT